MIRVEFYSLLRLLLKQETLTVPWQAGMTVERLLEQAQAAIPIPFLAKLIDDNGKLHPGTIILVERRNIHHLDLLQTQVSDGAVVALFPPGAGG